MTAIDSTNATALKLCCAEAYQSGWARFLLGESFHPGGLALTRQLGESLGITSSEAVLDIACGRGTSAMFLAETFGCRVVGIDLGMENVASARREAGRRGLAGRVSFAQGDAERMPLRDGAFDVAMTECSFCTFPDKEAASREIWRVLSRTGRFGMSDVTLEPSELPQELVGLAGWVACLGDAWPRIELRCEADERRIRRFSARRPQPRAGGNR